MRRIQPVIMLGLAAILGNTMPGFAGSFMPDDNSPSMAALQEQVKALEQRLQVLERLLKSQSGNGYDRPSAVSPAPARLAELDPKPGIQEKRPEPGPKDAAAKKNPII